MPTGKKGDYQVGYGKPPRNAGFKKGQSDNPRGRLKKDLPALLLAALNAPVFVAIDGKRGKITKREVIVTQMVNNAAGADLRATKMLIDMMGHRTEGPAWQRRRSRIASPLPTRR